MSAEQQEAKRKARHAIWLSQLSEDDWRRIRDLTEQLRSGREPVRIEDLDARRLAVGVRWVGDKGATSGERIGTVSGELIEVLVWAK